MAGRAQRVPYWLPSATTYRMPADSVEPRFMGSVGSQWLRLCGLLNMGLCLRAVGSLDLVGSVLA